MKPLKILVPVDFSDCSINAVKVAAKLALSWNSKLYILHATDLPTAVAFSGEAVVVPSPDGYQESVLEQLEQLPEQVPMLKKVEHELIDTFENLHAAIQSFVEKKNIHMIVMGMRDDYDVLEKWIGTNTMRVITTSRIPVLAVPSCVAEYEPNRIGVAIDATSLKKVSQLDVVASLAEMNDSIVDVFFIADEGESIDFGQSAIADIFNSYFRNIPCKFHNVHFKDVSEGILDFIRIHELDHIVVFPHSHTLMSRLFRKSTTKEVTLNSRVPVLALHT